jgi:hypothetical protein
MSWYSNNYLHFLKHAVPLVSSRRSIVLSLPVHKVFPGEGDSEERKKGRNIQ